MFDGSASVGHVFLQFVMWRHGMEEGFWSQRDLTSDLHLDQVQVMAQLQR